jgi:hypothetical protein
MKVVLNMIFVIFVQLYRQTIAAGMNIQDVVRVIKIAKAIYDLLNIDIKNSTYRQIAWRLVTKGQPMFFRILAIRSQI